MNSPLRAYILVTVQVGKEFEVLNHVKTNLPSDNVKEADVVYGEYDIIIRVEAESLEHLHNLVLKVRSNPYVRHTVTLVSAKRTS